MSSKIVWVSVLILLGVLLWLIPIFGWDLALSKYFYQNGFNWDPVWAHVVGKWGEEPSHFFAQFAILILGMGIILKNLQWTKAGFFLMIIGILVPWLIVSSIKIAAGRPRPFQIREFGGTSTYRQWYDFRGPAHNDRFKSFPSGHAASAAYLLTPFWIIGSRRLRIYYLILALSWWAYVALGRVIAGAHFLSDTVASLWLTIFIGGILAYLIRPRETTGASKNHRICSKHSGSF